MNKCKNITSKNQKKKSAIYYKYRDFKNIEYLLDIFSEHRLFASSYDKLNDPMEALFKHNVSKNKTILEEIKKEQEQYKVVSLSKAYDNILMWIHYADEHKGLVIGFEIEPNNDNSIIIEPIQYVKELPFLTFPEKDDLANFAKKVLTSKLCPWSYEEEVRILLKQNIDNNFHINIQDEKVRNTVKINIKEVYFGIRTPEIYKTLIKKYCNSCDINYEEMSNEKLNKEFYFYEFDKSNQ